MNKKLRHAIPLHGCTAFEALSAVFENPEDVTDFYYGCRDFSSIGSFLDLLDKRYEQLKMLNNLPGPELGSFMLQSTAGHLTVVCRLKPEFIPRHELPTITPLLGCVYIENLKALYPNANVETLIALKDFIWDNSNCAGGAEIATEIIKSWNRQLNDGDDYIVLRAKDVRCPFITHKFCINKKDLY